MRKISLLLFAAAALLQVLTGCQAEDAALPKNGSATVAIRTSMIGTDSSSVAVTFIPSEEAVSFRYAIGTDEDFESFCNGTLASTETECEAGASYEVIFEDLTPLSVYSVFAVAKDGNGLEGSAAVAKLSTDDPDIKFTEQYVLNNSAGFKISISSNYRGLTYYMGKTGEMDAFLAGETYNTTVNDVNEYTVNGFDLEPETDYALYVRITDRAGNTAKIIEHEFRTTSAGPDVALEYENDFYSGEYTLTPSNGCTRMAALISLGGENDDVIYSRVEWKGDLMAMLESWQNVESMGVQVSESGKPLSMTYVTPDLVLDNPIEIYVLLYDESGEACGVKHFDLSTPAFDGDAPEATVTISISDITASGATYTYTSGEGTVAFLYDTVEADWFDEFAESEEYYGHYIHDLLYSNGKWWAYMQQTVTYTETEGEPGTRYYAVACPMNCNGLEGWGELVMKEYTTTQE